MAAHPNKPPPIPRKARLRLLEVAREAIFQRLQRGSVPPFSVTEAELQAPMGAFVSLHLEGDLRGCIGTLHGERPLHEVVAEMACEAATNDPRFPALTTRELSQTDIEVSVLTPFQPIQADEVEVGRHGLYVVRGPRRGVLLPQVPVQYGWTREQYLQHACRKAGLPEDAYKDPETRLLSFEAEVFSDSSLAL
jgi:AmmeMemoRadiSam system protein A